MAEKPTAKKRKPLSRALKTFYGCGDCGFTLMTNVETYYFNFFLTNLAMFSVEMTAIITTVASIVDACLSWIYGGILNAAKPMKWGRYRSWLIVVPWCVPFLYACQFLKIGDGVGAAVIIIAAAIVSHIVWNFAYVANATMMAVAGGDAQGRATLSSSRATWYNMASVLFSYLGLPLANVLAAVVGEVNKFAAVAFVLGILMVVGYYVHFRLFEGYEEVEIPQERTKKAVKEKTSAGDMVKSLFQNVPLLSLLVAHLGTFIVKFVVAGSSLYYFTYAVNRAGLQTSYVLAANLAAVVGAYAARHFAARFTNRGAMIISYIIMIASMLGSFVLYRNAVAVIALMTVAQFGYGICYACAPALYADTAIYAEWKSGKSSVGWIMGLQNVPLKVAVILKAGIIAACLSFANFSPDIDPAQASEALQRGVTASFALVPALFNVLSLLLLIFGYRLTKETVARYQAEIDARA